MSRFLHLPWLQRLLCGAAAVVPANSETRNLLISRGIAAREVMLDTGAPEIPGVAAPDPGDIKGDCRFIFAGRLERRKGLELSLRAFAKAAADEHFQGTFRILGDGPDRDRLQAMAAELGRSGITVNAIAPGYFATEMNTALLEDKVFNAWVEGRTPAGRWAKPEELGGAVVFLASDAAAYVNGHILAVDGGLSVTM